jgi:NitT/TauT family transport system ATP-binding protein
MSLSIKSLSKKFGEKIIFQDFSYDFKDKRVYALTGESGIGKTTLLRMIAGLDTDYDGIILNGGKRNTSFLFQEYRLFPEISVLDNVIYANHDKKTPENEKEAKNILFKLGFNESDVYLFPREISGGMKQRAALARAFLRATPLLLLDEPTKELDYENSKIVLSLIKEEARKRLVIMVTHRVDEVKEIDATVIALDSERK